MKTTAQPPTRSLTRRNATEQRRREILDAALACFLENGVADTTIEQIRVASKASHGSIYHQFRSKDEIALTLFVDGMQTYHRKVLAAIENGATARGIIRAIIATHLQGIVDDPPLALYLTRLGMADDSGEISERYRLLSNDFAQAVWEHLKPFVDRGEIARFPKEFYFSLIIGPAAHLSRGWLRGRIECDLISATDQLAAAAWKSLRSDR